MSCNHFLAQHQKHIRLTQEVDYVLREHGATVVVLPAKKRQVVTCTLARVWHCSVICDLHPEPWFCTDAPLQISTATVADTTGSSNSIDYLGLCLRHHSSVLYCQLESHIELNVQAQPVTSQRLQPAHGVSGILHIGSIEQAVTQAFRRA
jgi:hypothetical protein